MKIVSIVRAAVVGVVLAGAVQLSAQTNDLAIATTSLPTAYAHAKYVGELGHRGGMPPFHWKVQKGELPPGIKLEDDGGLHGSPESTGDYRFTVSLSDNSKAPPVERELVLHVIAALALKWKTPAHVTGSEIAGSVEATNATGLDFDFTFVVLAVNDEGRATAIGYQRFDLKKGTTDFELPFGDTLPPGSYVVHVDAVGEVEKEDEIFRARLETPAPLVVTAGP